MIGLSQLFTDTNFVRFINLMHEGIICLDAAGKVILCNKAAEKILGLSADQMMGITYMEPLWHCIHEDGSDFTAETRPTAITLKTGQPQYNVVVGIYQSGGQFNWVFVNTEPVFSGEDHQLSEVIVSFVDITEQKKAEETIRNTKDFYESIINNINADIAVFDNNNKYIFLNKSAIKNDELRQWKIGKDNFEYCRKQGKDIRIAEQRTEKIREAFASNQQVEFVEELTDQAGNKIWLLRILKPFTIGNKQRYLVGCGLNITQLKKTENELLEKENYLQTLINSIPDILFRVDKDGRILDCKVEDKNLLAFRPEDFLGKTFYEVWPKEIADFHMGYTHKAFNGEKLVIYEYPMITVTGEKGFFEARIKKINEEEAVIICRDITESKTLTDKIIASEKLLTQSQELAHIGSWEWDIITNQVFWSDELYRIFSFAPKEFKITFEEYLKYIHPDDREMVENVVRQAYNDHKPYSLFHRTVRSDGDIRIVLGMGEVEENEKGEAVKMRGTAQDVTQIKKAEEKLNKLNNELSASNKELEQFAYVASHDLQEPLRMVSSFMKLLIKRTEGQLDETTQQYIHFAVGGAERMKSLIQALLEYSRVGTNKEDFSDVDLNEVMQYTTRVLEEDIRKKQAVITMNPMPIITANKILISQLFVNLISNALKFHGDKEPKIEVGFTENAEQWTFYVKDNGIGIEAKDMDRIFIIFQRLHSKNGYPGTGIGLSVCKKIVEIHKGKIWVESEPGNGSTFYFSLPTGQAGIPKQNR